MRTIATRISMMAAALALAAGCTSSTDNEASKGAAPTISDLALSPTDVAVGKVNSLSGSLVVDDADGDVAQLGADITLPDGSQQSLPKTAAQGVDGAKHGQLVLAFAFGPPAAGAYQVAIYVIDAKGNESNRLSTTLTAK